MPFKPEYPGEIPTLGWSVLSWITEMLAAPDRGEYEPFIPTPEQAEFILRYYELDPNTGKRRIHRGVISRPRGWGKSPFLAAIACAEALADVVPDGWDARGRPVGRPWSDVRTPLVQVAAVSEAQTRNAWDPLLEMLREGPVMGAYAIDPMDRFVALPRGKIMPITSGADSAKGNRAVFAVLDQTEQWTVSNGGLKLFDIMHSNAIKVAGSFIESPNAFTPGLDSVAERTANAHKLLRESGRLDSTILYDHREVAPDVDLSDRGALLEALAYVYGDSADTNGGWVDLERIAESIYDPSMDVQQTRSDFLNQITHAADSWLSHLDIRAITDREKVVEDGEAITLGFDGSRKRQRGITDATALVGCRVSDGHLFAIGVWEQPSGYEGRDWEIPVAEVEATVHDAFSRWNVVGMYADPALWESYIAGWEAKYGKKLKIKSSEKHPIERWVGSARMTTWVRSIETLENAILNREITFDGSAVLTRHLLNARRRQSTRGMQIAKAFPDSPNKIDAAIAAILAYEARHHAHAAGLTGRKKSRAMRRI